MVKYNNKSKPKYILRICLTITINLFKSHPLHMNLETLCKRFPRIKIIKELSQQEQQQQQQQ